MPDLTRSKQAKADAERIAALEAEVEDLGAKLNEYIDKTRDAEADLAALRVAVDAVLWECGPARTAQWPKPPAAYSVTGAKIEFLRAARDGKTHD